MNKGVAQADPQQAFADPRLGHYFGHGDAETTGDHMVFHRDHTASRVRDGLGYRVRVERLVCRMCRCRIDTPRDRNACVARIASSVQIPLEKIAISTSPEGWSSTTVRSLPSCIALSAANSRGTSPRNIRT